MPLPVTLNCDMGEAFGLYRMGDDEGLMPLINVANVACGFHASDYNHMRTTVQLARRHGVKVGAHPSLPDLQGFGRREMVMTREEMANCVIYQVGALKGFLDADGMVLNHIKPHGVLYGMAARQEHIAHAICDAADVFEVPVMGLAGTLHEEIYTERGHRFISEFYADLDYADDGKLIITREHDAKDPCQGRSKMSTCGDPRRGLECRGQKIVRQGGNHLRSFRHAQCGGDCKRDPRCGVQPSREEIKPERGRPRAMATEQILSPLPGTFYRRASPEDPTYKNDGDMVAVGDVIGLVEVMKSFHEVKSDKAGKIVRFVVKNEDAIMAGQPLADVEV